MSGHVSLKGKLRTVGVTDTGRVREHNEDAIVSDPEIGLFVLADGMGGYNAGEVASGIAVKTIMNLVREAYETQDLSGTDKMSGLSRPAVILRDAIARANKIIHQTSKTQEQCEGFIRQDVVSIDGRSYDMDGKSVTVRALWTESRAHHVSARAGCVLDP